MVNAIFAEGICEERLAAYHDCYATINPWFTMFETMEHGQICATENEHPSSSFQDSQFYREWLVHQDNLRAASAMRIDIDPANVVIVDWHYGVDQASRYDILAAKVLSRLKPNLTDAVRSAAMLSHRLEQNLQVAPVIEQIHGGALVVDAKRHIREANTEAKTAMAEGEIYGGGSGRLSLRDPAAQRWLEEAISKAHAGSDEQEITATFGNCNAVYRLGVIPLALHENAGYQLLVHPPPVVLVIIRLLTGRLLRLDVEALQLAFGLSGAEARLCEFLVDGTSLIETARILAISEGTVRQRAKTVFQKTGTSRQGELIALVCHFAIRCEPAGKNTAFLQRANRT